MSFCKKKHILKSYFKVSKKTNLLITALTILSFFGLSMPSAIAQNFEVSEAVGYQRITITEGRLPDNSVFNFMGVNFTNKILAQGFITNESPNMILDFNADFTSSLNGASNLYIQIISSDSGSSDTLVGINSEVEVLDRISLSTTQDLSDVSEPGDEYIVRETMTIADIFGPNNERKLFPNLDPDALGNTIGADKVWVPNEIGGFDQYYYNAAVNNNILTPGWKKEGTGNSDASNDPIYFTKGIFIERVFNHTTDTFISGHVNTSPVVIPLKTGFTPINTIFPIGATLGNSHLYGIDLNNDADFNDPGESGPGSDQSTFVDPDSSGPVGRDVIWMQTPDRSSWDQFFFSALVNPFFGFTPGWKKEGEGNANFGNEPLRGGVYIQRSENAGPLNLTLKSNISTLRSSDFQIASIHLRTEYTNRVLSEVHVNVDNTLIGFSYAIQSSVDMVNWTHLYTVAGNGQTITFVDPFPSSNIGFYRVVRAPFP